METWTFGHIKIDGFQNEPQEGYIELTPDAGVPYRRERFSDIQDIVKGNFTVDKADYIRFMSWYKIQLKQGSVPFLMHDCRIKKDRVARIVGKPTYTTNSKYFDISLTITFDSEVFYSEDKYLVANPINGLVASVLNKYFNIVGSPVITDDGIASGFSSDNYLTNDLQAIGKSPFKIIIKFNSGTVNTARTLLFLGSSNSNTTFTRIRIHTNNGMTAWLKLANGTDISSALAVGVVPADTDMMYKFEWDGEIYRTGISYDDGKTWVQAKQYQSTSPLVSSDYTGISIGSANGQEPHSGSIDLKQFSITVDDVKVFDGSQIPYEGKLLIANTRYSL